MRLYKKTLVSPESYIVDALIDIRYIFHSLF